MYVEYANGEIPEESEMGSQGISSKEFSVCKFNLKKELLE
jgi:hypothetical protein